MRAQFFGAGKDMGFVGENDEDPYLNPTASFRNELSVTELCVTQLTGSNEDGVNLDVIVQKFDPRGSTLYKSVPSDISYSRGTENSQGQEKFKADLPFASLVFAEYQNVDDNSGLGEDVVVGRGIKKCVRMEEVKFDFKFQPRETSFDHTFEQNALTYTAEFDSDFAVTTYGLAFDVDDPTIPAHWRDLTQMLGAGDEKVYPLDDSNPGILDDDGRINAAFDNVDRNGTYGIKVGLSGQLSEYDKQLVVAKQTPLTFVLLLLVSDYSNNEH